MHNTIYQMDKNDSTKFFKSLNNLNTNFMNENLWYIYLFIYIFIQTKYLYL